MGAHRATSKKGGRSAARAPGSWGDARRGALAGAAAGLLVLGGTVVAISSGVFDDDPPSPSAAPSPTAKTSAVRIEPRRGSAAPLRKAAPPTRLVVPALRIKAPVDAVEITPAGVLDPPADVSRVGWWQRSAPIGAGSGQTVMTGHSVHDGGGVMDELEQLERGDVVRTFHDRRVARYRVQSVRVWSKAELAERAEQVFAQDRRNGRLVLISCEDWNGSDWESNVVVFATRADRA